MQREIKLLNIVINILKRKSMIVEEVKLGNGLVRLEVKPTCSCERNIPTSVIDDVMRDIIRRKKCEREAEARTKRIEAERIERERMQAFGTMPCGCGVQNREPDGIDVHVDRPRKEQFCSISAWADALGKYRNLERAAKDCDWPCKEPMRGIPCQPKRVEKPKRNERIEVVIVEDENGFDDFTPFGW